MRFCGIYSSPLLSITLFKSLPLADKVSRMLLWFVSADIRHNALLNGYTIQVTDVQCTAETLPSGALDSRAPLKSIRRYFCSEAWDAVQAAIRAKKNNDLWYCKKCGQDDDGSLKMISCDLCLEWFHWQCVGLTRHKVTGKSPWFCASCQD